MMKNYSVKIIVLKIIENSFEALFSLKIKVAEWDFQTLLVFTVHWSAITAGLDLINPPAIAEYYLDEKINLFTLLTIMRSSLLGISLSLSTSLHLFPV